MHLTQKNNCKILMQRGADRLRTWDRFATEYTPALLWLSGLMYKFALDALYIWAASPQYAYAGLVLDPVSWKYLLSLVLYLVLFTALPKQEQDTTSFLLHLQFVYTVAPMLSFYALSNGSSRYILMVSACVMLQIWILRNPSAPKNSLRLPRIQNYVTVMLGILACFTLIVPILYNGFDGLNAFSFTHIYEMRANAQFPPGFGYLFNWMQKAVIPFAFLYTLHQKKYGWTLLCSLIQILFFMESGWKFTLLILIPLLGIYLFSKTGHLLKLMYAGLVSLFLLVLLCYQLDRAGGLSSLGVRMNFLVSIRAIFIPADTKFDFYECFQLLPHVYFSDGLVGKLLGLTYPYSGSLGQVVYAYTGGAFLESNSNTGYLGEAYAQMGFLGMLLMSLLLAVILKALQRYDTPEHVNVLTALFSVSMIILNDGALFTTLLTGGMLVAFALVVVYLNPSLKGGSHGIQRV